MKRYSGKIPTQNKWIKYSSNYNAHYFDYDKKRCWFEQALILYFPMKEVVHRMIICENCEIAKEESIYMNHIIKCFKKIQKQQK